MKPNLVPVVSLGLIALFVVYMWAISDQPRMADGALIGDEVRWYEEALILAVVIPVFATMAIAARRAVRAGSWVWLLACLFVWPLSYLYTLAIERGDEA
jgi:hypothetical protein